jgi:hypothetical protein
VEASTSNVDTTTARLIHVAGRNYVLMELIKHYVMKAYEGVNVEIHVFLTLGTN